MIMHLGLMQLKTWHLFERKWVELGGQSIKTKNNNALQQKEKKKKKDWPGKEWSIPGSVMLYEYSISCVLAR